MKIMKTSHKKFFSFLITLLVVFVSFSVSGKLIRMRIDTSFYNSSLFDIKRLNVTFESSGYKLYGEVYYPKDTSLLYPVVIFCIGQPGYVSAYRWIPMEIAKRGYVSMLFDPPGLGYSEGIFPNWNLSINFLNLYLRYFAFIETPIHYYHGRWTRALLDALEFLLGLEDVQHVIDKRRIGLVGHSLGGATVIEVAANSSYNFSAVVALSLVTPSSVGKIKAPLMLQSGDLDFFPIFPMIMCPSYERANPPRELIMLQSATHFGFTTAWGPFCPCPKWQKEISFHYIINWLDYFVKGKKDAYKNLTVAVPHLSKMYHSKYNFGDGDHIIA